jgi:hypothetical protein
MALKPIDELATSTDGGARDSIALGAGIVPESKVKIPAANSVRQ